MSDQSYYSSKPSRIALLNALLISLFASLLVAGFMAMASVISFPLLVIFFILVFIISYLLIKYSIDTFIYEKIKVIYRTIGSMKTRDEQENTDDQKGSGDVLEIVNQAVFNWREKQKKEVAELKQMARYRREFVGNVSHELKTPIFNIQGYIHTLLDGGLYDETINKDYLKRARKSVDRLIAIVEDLGEISKFESGEMKLEKENFELNELIREVIEFLDMKASEANARIDLVSSSNYYYVHADKKRIKQVLINLIDNAIKYGDPEKGVIKISVHDFYDYFLVEVADNGMGIPEEFVFRVFERFFRTDLARSRKSGGSGLGLAIVKHIIEAHNQKITVRNNPDKGSTFSFTLRKAK